MQHFEARAAEVRQLRAPRGRQGHQQSAIDSSGFLGFDRTRHGGRDCGKANRIPVSLSPQIAESAHTA